MAKPEFLTPSGRLVTKYEEDSLFEQIRWDSLLQTDWEIISGALPVGVEARLSGTESQTLDLVGVITPIPTPDEEFFFTLRLTNEDGFVDRGYSIYVINIQPEWANPTDFPYEKQNSDTVDYQFEIFNPGGIVSFEKISGELPPALQINKQGRMYGTIGTDGTKTFYEFTVRATLNDGSYIDKTLSMTIEPQSKPIWLSSKFLGNIDNGSQSSMRLSAYFPSGLLKYKLVANGGQLPNGLTLQTDTGMITGVCSVLDQRDFLFSAIAYTETGIIVESEPKEFIINTNSKNENSIDWVSDNDLGEIYTADSSFMAVQATSSLNIKYEIVESSDSFPLDLLARIPAGSSLVQKMPKGLQLQQSTGQIIGTVWLQDENLPAYYWFVIKASNAIYNVSKTFYVNVKTNIQSNALTSYIGLSLNYQDNWRNLISNIDYDDLYDPSSEDYGMKTLPRINLVNNLVNTPKSIIQEQVDMMKNVEFVVGETRRALARDVNGEVIYEVLYKMIYPTLETYEEALERFNILYKNKIKDLDTTSVDVNGRRNDLEGLIQTFKDEYHDLITEEQIKYGVDLKPSTILDLRNQLIEICGVDGQDIYNGTTLVSSAEKLPLWMTTPQVEDNPNSVLGWFPCVEIAYCKPDRSVVIYLNILENESREEVDYMNSTLMEHNDANFENLLYMEQHPFDVTFFNKHEQYSDISTRNLQTPEWDYEDNLLGTFNVGDVVSLSVFATDPNMIPISYKLMGGSSLPSGLTVSDTGSISGTIDDTNMVGEYGFDIIATNLNALSKTKSFKIIIE